MIIKLTIREDINIKSSFYLLQSESRCSYMQEKWPTGRLPTEINKTLITRILEWRYTRVDSYMATISDGILDYTEVVSKVWNFRWTIRKIAQISPNLL